MPDKEKTHIEPVEDGSFIRLPEEVLSALGLSPGKEVKIRLTGNRVTIERHIADPFAEYRNRPEAPSMDDLIQADAEKKRLCRKSSKNASRKNRSIHPKTTPTSGGRPGVARTPTRLHLPSPPTNTSPQKRRTPHG